MKMNTDALKALELKLAEYSKENGVIGEYESSNMNCVCSGKNCQADCMGSCESTCSGSCRTSRR